MERDINSEKYKKVQKRVHEIKQFYKHFSIYLLINLVFIGRRIYIDISNGDAIIDAFTAVSNYSFFFWWGIGLIIHGILVFGAPKFFSKDWEKRKVEELMNK